MIERLQNAWETSSAGRWYAGKEPSEQRFLMLLGIITTLLVLWAGVWKPISDWRSTAADRHRNAEAALTYLRRNEADARRVAASQRGGGGGRSSLPLISRSAQTNGVRLARVQPDGDRFTVVLQAQPFDDVIRWIHSLEANNGIRVVQAAVDTEAEGVVNARLSLE